MKIRNISILLGSLAAALFSSAAFANEGGAAAAGNYNALGAGIGIAIAVFGGAIGQSRAAAAALEGISRNPAASKSIFTPMLLALALIEALVILAWLVCFIKIPV